MMETEFLQQVSATNEWSALLPEIILGVSAILLLFLDLLVPRSRQYLASISIGIQILAGAVMLLVISRAGGTRELFGGLVAQGVTGDWMRFFFIVSSIFVTHIGSVFLSKQKLAHVEFYHLVLIVSATFMVLVQSNHFFLLFVALETLTIGFYILVAYKRDGRPSLEAGLKYLIMGALSSGMLLFGIALLYGAASNPALPMSGSSPLQFGNLQAFIAAGDNRSNLLVLTGAILVLTGIAFKIGVVPFQIWVPDVYQGAPTPITAFLAVSSKAAGFYILYLLLQGPFAALDGVTVPLLSVIAILTLVFGNIAAIGQRNVKRVMGLSGVAHAGILLMGLIASLSIDWAFTAVLFYLVTYAFASFGVFEVMAHVVDNNDADQDLDIYDDLLARDPYLGGILVVNLGSLAGIPPLAGFAAKLLIFIAAFQADLLCVLGFALLGVVISIYYYFGWMRSAVMHNPFVGENAVQTLKRPGLVARFLMGILTAGTLIFGVYQGLFPF